MRPAKEQVYYQTKLQEAEHMPYPLPPGTVSMHVRRASKRDETHTTHCCVAHHFQALQLPNIPLDGFLQLMLNLTIQFHLFKTHYVPHTGSTAGGCLPYLPAQTGTAVLSEPRCNQPS